LESISFPLLFPTGAGHLVIESDLLQDRCQVVVCLLLVCFHFVGELQIPLLELIDLYIESGLVLPKDHVFESQIVHLVRHRDRLGFGLGLAFFWTRVRETTLAACMLLLRFSLSSPPSLSDIARRLLFLDDNIELTFR